LSFPRNSKEKRDEMNKCWCEDWVEKHSINLLEEEVNIEYKTAYAVHNEHDHDYEFFGRERNNSAYTYACVKIVDSNNVLYHRVWRNCSFKDNAAGKSFGMKPMGGRSGQQW
jgi:hypothetical protein